jgi:predicted alpha/beta hydrolase family esterase
MAQRRFLLLHGVEHHKPPGHWLYQLARALRDAGEGVSYPQLPDADEPSLEHWRATLARELDALDVPDVPDDEDAEAESVVVCHSLGCLLWLHHCARPAAHRRVDRVLLVAPPSPEILWPAVAAFRPPSDLDAVAVTAAARADTRVVAGADDPYCPGGAQTVFAAPLRLDADVIAGGRPSQRGGRLRTLAVDDAVVLRPRCAAARQRPARRLATRPPRRARGGLIPAPPARASWTGKRELAAAGYAATAAAWSAACGARRIAHATTNSHTISTARNSFS